MATRQQDAQAPRDYLANMTRFTQDALRVVSPGAVPPAANRPDQNAGQGNNAAAVAALAQLSSQAQSEMFALTMELHDTQRDAQALNKEVEKLSETLEAKEAAVTDLNTKLLEAERAHVAKLAEIGTANQNAINEANEAYRIEKAGLEEKIAAGGTQVSDLEKKVTELTAELEEKLAAATKELEEKTTELQTKIDELIAANEALTQEKAALQTQKDEAEANAQKLGAKKLGLVAPPAAASKVEAPADPAKAAETLSTETGDAIAPKKELTMAAASAAGRVGATPGDDTGADEEMNQLGEVLSAYCELSAVKNKVSGKASTSAEERERIAFMNDPRPGCEGCAASPDHHHKLVLQAIFRRNEIAKYFQATA